MFCQDRFSDCVYCASPKQRYVTGNISLTFFPIDIRADPGRRPAQAPRPGRSAVHGRPWDAQTRCLQPASPSSRPGVTVVLRRDCVNDVSCLPAPPRPRCPVPACRHGSAGGPWPAPTTNRAGLVTDASWEATLRSRHHGDMPPSQALVLVHWQDHVQVICRDRESHHQ